MSTEPNIEQVREQEVGEQVEHLHGSADVTCHPDDVVVVCLVRDGQPWIRDFLKHHFSLGVKHVVFMDNGSTDGTVDIAAEYDAVTVLRILLPFKTHKQAAKRYASRRFGKGSWVLCVDIDELFEYPYSDVVGLNALIEYLKRKSYTAVATQTLDMFPENSLFNAAEDADLPLREVHRFYDLSNIRREEYVGSRRRADNVISNYKIQILRDGIQNTISGHPMILTRHPLIFMDERIKPMTHNGHWVDKARIADFTGVIFHYKFLSSFHQRAVQYAEEGGHGGDSIKYKRYLGVLEKTPDLQIKQETSKELHSVNDLVDEDFLTVSESYMKWVDEIEDESPLRKTLRQSPHKLAGAFSKARALRAATSRVARRAKHRTDNLERKVCAEREKAKQLEQRNVDLESELRQIRESRAWRALENSACLRDGLSRKHTPLTGKLVNATRKAFFRKSSKSDSTEDVGSSAEGGIEHIEHAEPPAKPDTSRQAEDKQGSGYWAGRTNLMYYQYVDFLVRALAADCQSLIDVGSADAQYIENFDWIKKKNTLDIRKPYESEAVEGIKIDFFDFKPEQKYDFATCLQVLEHIPDAEAFAGKLFQTAHRVLISVPYLWKEGSTPSHIHDPVDLEKLIGWTGREPDYYIIVEEPLRDGSKRRRLVVYYHPKDEKLNLNRARRNIFG